MLTYNLFPIFNLRGIPNPYNYLVKLGISPTVARKMLFNDSYIMRLKHIELMCLHLNCTPNDLLMYVPSPSRNLSQTIPLDKLRKENNEANLQTQLQSLNIDQLKEVSTIIDQYKENLKKS